jgi:hypothetical protein
MIRALALLIMALAPAAASSAPPVSARFTPEFSDIRTVAAARKLVAEGRLVAIYLFPTEFGGPKTRHNVAYVPPETEEVRALILGTIERMTRAGTVDQMTIEPDYRGKSIIPISLRIEAWHSTKPGRFDTVIHIW